MDVIWDLFWNLVAGCLSLLVVVACLIVLGSFVWACNLIGQRLHGYLLELIGCAEAELPPFVQGLLGALSRGIVAAGCVLIVAGALIGAFAYGCFQAFKNLVFRNDSPAAGAWHTEHLDVPPRPQKPSGPEKADRPYVAVDGSAFQTRGEMEDRNRSRGVYD